MAYNQLPGADEVYEQELDEELAAAGLSSLPAKYLRQTPGQALRTAHFWINYIITIGVNFGVNVGFGKALIKDGDSVGLWQKPENESQVYSGAIWSDFLATCFIITSINALLASGGLADAVSKGQSMPVDNRSLGEFPWKYFPARIRSMFWRCMMMTIENLIIYLGPTLLILYFIQSSGAFNGSGGDSWMAADGYVYFKAGWASGCAAICYPVIYIASLNRKYLPQEKYETFLRLAKDKFDKDTKGLPTA